MEKLDRNVFILGAGASVDAGCPLMSEFLDRARDMLDARQGEISELEAEQISMVLDFRHSAGAAKDKFRADLDNIEELFGFLEMAHRLDESLLNVRDAAATMITRTLEWSVIERRRHGIHNLRVKILPEYIGYGDELLGKAPFNPSMDAFTPDLYNHFALFLAKKYDAEPLRARRKNTVLTFNYDTVLDTQLRGIGAIVDYGLCPDETQHDAITVLKLHGSINWGVCNCGPGKPEVIDSLDELMTQQCTKCGALLRPMIVPPSWTKADHRGLTERIWRRAMQELRLASRICVIGYSMPASDAFFRYLLTIGLQNNRSLQKFLVVNSDATVEEKYGRLFDPDFRTRRFKFLGFRFAQFLAGGLSSLGRAEAVQIDS